MAALGREQSIVLLTAASAVRLRLSEPRMSRWALAPVVRFAYSNNRGYRRSAQVVTAASAVRLRYVTAGSRLFNRVGNNAPRLWEAKASRQRIPGKSLQRSILHVRNEPVVKRANAARISVGSD